MTALRSPPGPPASAAETTGRRERKKLATRQALHEAAVTLAEERGLAHVTVEAITERADVAVRTFFNYFSSKEEAILARLPGQAERVRRALAARPASEDPLEVMRVVAVSELIPAEPDVARLLRRMRLVRNEPTLKGLIAAHYEELQSGAAAEIATRTGTDASLDAYPNVVAAAAFAACKVAMLQWCAAGGSEDPAAAIARAFDVLASGLTPPPRPCPPTKETTRP